MASPRFDAVTMYLAVAEVMERCAGGKLRKIRQLSSHVLLLSLWCGRDEDILLSVAPDSARLHCVTDAYGHADTPSAFCMLLRKHLLDSRLEAATTYGLERIARLDFESPHDGAQRSLIVELLPRQRGLVLLDEEDRVLGDTTRTRRRGDSYEPTLAPATDALSMTAHQLLGTLDELAAIDPKLTLLRALPKAAFGIGPQQARLLLDMAALPPRLEAEAWKHDDAGRARLESAWVELTQRIQGSLLEPTLVEEGEGAPLILPWPGPTLRATPGDEVEPLRRAAEVDSEAEPPCEDDDEAPHGPDDPAWEHARLDPPHWGLLLEQAFGSGSSEAALEQVRQRLLQRLARHRERLERRLHAQEADARGAEQADAWRHQGDLLTANLHRIPARSSEITVVDYTHPEGLETTIPLDPLLSPQENAQRLYQRYKKALRRAASLAETMAHSREDLLYADELATAIATARGREELKALGSELAGDGWVESSRQAAPSRGKGPTARPRKYLIEGHEVLVGRHPRQNEQLTRTLARPHDIWMHARQLPGAHVLVRSQGTSKEPPDQVLLAAAALAAASSSAASSARVAVDWTQARHVRKPSGSPAGFVIYSRERTILVDPAQAAALEALRRS